MRIGIDARFLTYPQRGGFKTYTTYLVRGLAAVDRENDYILYTDRALPEGSDPLPPSMRLSVLGGGAPLVGAAWREQAQLAWAARRDQLDLLHAPALTAPLAPGCPLVVTIHDMLWAGQKPAAQLSRRLMQRYYAQVAARSARRADLALTVSQAAATEIEAALPFLAGRIVVTPEAAAPHFRPVAGAVERVAERVGLPAGAEGYVLAIGSADPRKNVAALVAAYAQLAEPLRRRFPLVIVWTHGHLAGQAADQARTLGLEGQIHFVQGVDDAALVDLYNAATLFVFPSLGEGFGLPLLEAMACGAPVIAADNSSIPEVAGDAALYFEARDVDGMAATLRGVLEDGALRADLRGRGLARAAGFTWERCARLTMAAYAQAVGGAG